MMQNTPWHYKVTAVLCIDPLLQLQHYRILESCSIVHIRSYLFIKQGWITPKPIIRFWDERHSCVSFWYQVVRLWVKWWPPWNGWIDNYHLNLWVFTFEPVIEMSILHQSTVCYNIETLHTHHRHTEVVQDGFWGTSWDRYLSLCWVQHLHLAN